MAADQANHPLNTPENLAYAEKLLGMSEDELFEELGSELYNLAEEELRQAIHEVLPGLATPFDTGTWFTALGIDDQTRDTILELAITKAEQSNLRDVNTEESSFNPLTIGQAIEYILGLC